MRGASTAMVGRQAELDWLDHALESVAAGVPTFSLVVGEAGIGKTKLLGAAAVRGRERGLRVLSGSGIQSGTTVPFLPLLAPLADAIGQGSEDPASATIRELLTGIPADPARATTSEAWNGEVGAARLITSIFDVLVAEPTLLIVDDVHWADASTLTVLDYLARRASNTPLGVIAAARDDESGLLGSLPIADGRHYRQLAVRRLSENDVRDQVEGLLGEAPTSGLAERIFERSAGNPLFVEELVAADAGSNDDGDASPVGAAGTSIALRSLILGRFERLSEFARRSVEAVAVLGRSAGEGLIADVADIPPEAVSAGLDEAIRGGIATTAPAGYGLRHPVMNEVVAAALTDTQQRRLHRRAAEALVAIGGATVSAAELARHWAMAGDGLKAWAASLAAADEAERSFAFAEARGHLERASDHWPTDAPGRSAVLLRAGQAAWMAGDTRAALELTRIVEADLATDRGPDAPHALDVFIAQGRYAWDVGEMAVAAAAFSRAAEEIDETTPPAARALAIWGLGRSRVLQGRIDEAYECALVSAAAAEEAGHLAWQAQAWVLGGMSRAFAGRDGTTEMRRALELATQAEHPSSTAHAYQFLVDLLGLAGRRDEALEVARRGIEAVERYGLARTHGSDLRGRAAMLLLEDGRWDEAAEVVVPADPRPVPCIVSGLLAMRHGRFAEAEDSLARAVVAGAVGGPGAVAGRLHLARVELAWLRGDADAARQILAEAPRSIGIWASPVDAWRAVWRARLDGEAPASPVPAPAAADPALHRALDAELAAEGAGRRNGVSANLWGQAVGGWSAIDRPYEAAWAQLRQAEAGFAGADRAIAKAALHEAATAADRLGAAPLAARAEDVARRARVSARPIHREIADPSTLTEREHDVLGLLSDGRTNRQIGELLFLSPKTVGIHVSRILDKLDAATRGEAVAAARRGGLIQ